MLEKGEQKQRERKWLIEGGAMANPYDKTDPPFDREAWEDLLEFNYTYPPKISSDGGYWGPNDIQLFVLPMVEARFIAIFFCTQLFHFLLRRFGFTRLTSEILAGSLLTIYLTRGHYETFVEEVLSVIAKFNYIFFLFIMGVKMDMSIVRSMEKKLCVFGSLIVLIPMLLGITATWLLASWYNLDYEAQFALLSIALIHSTTLFSVIVYLLNEVRILNSELGRLALSLATVSDLICLFVSCTLSTIKTGASQHLRYTVTTVGFICCYMALLALVIRPSVLWVIRQGSHVQKNCVFVLVGMAFGCTGVFYLLDMNMFLAPYMLGLAIPSGPPLGSILDAKYNPFLAHVFLPFFVSFCSSNANLNNITLDYKATQSIIAVMLLISFFKLGSCFILALNYGLPTRDALSLAMILSSKGLMDIADYTITWEIGIIPNMFLSVALVFILVTSALVPIFLRSLYDPSRKYGCYKKRNLINSISYAELPILACIYRSENISSMVKLIDTFAVEADNPVCVYALHLMSLTGQAAPVFVAHGLRCNALSDYSFSRDVILSFKQLAYQNSSVSSLYAFTAISPPQLMKEDICTLALDKSTSFIILPFHRVWTLGGDQYDDNAMRTLNYSLLERSPCSLGILVDRGHIGSRMHARGTLSRTFNIAMIFLGGGDDREALTLAKRMSRSPLNILTVIHFTGSDADEMASTETKLDTQILRDVKSGYGNGNVMYKDVWVEDGNHMIEMIRSFIGSYKLVIVGRRCNETSHHTAGLEIWSDFPELGLVGDLLTTGDFDAEYSVLVVNQQAQV